MRREIQKSKKRFVFSALVCAAAFSITAPWGLKAYAAEAGEWRQEDGVNYWYEYGVKQGLEGRGKEIYDPESDAWYWLDSVQDGAMAVSKDVYQESEAGDWGDFVNDEGKRCGKWVRYDENGHMIKGWDTNDNGTYYFDPVYGTMAKGTATIDGEEYTFDPDTGILTGMPAPILNGWAVENGVAYWYENGVKQGLEGRGKEIYDPGSDAWYWLDSVQNGAMAVSKDVYQESEAGDWGDFVNDEGKRCGKWVRYDENGHMVKGWSTGENGTYYFDPVYGTMAKGRAQIDGIYYVFNQTTGVLEKDESRCNLPLSSSYYKYEYAYRTQDLSGLSQEDMPFYEALKAYLDYALQYDTPFLQEKAIHNYMLLNCEYDYENFCNGTIPWVSYSAAGVLVHKTAVCSGYASAFQLFMDILGIECETITSNQLNHAWNRVRLDGDWYMVDVTWDDPVPDQAGRIRYDYFNMPSRFFRHEASDYLQTAEGIKWMGDAVYYVNTEEADERIAEILKEEVKLLSPERILLFYVTPTANLSIREYIETGLNGDMEHAYTWFALPDAESSSMLIRLTTQYSSYEEYEKACIGDAIYTCTMEEAEDTILQVLKDEVQNMAKNRSVAFYVTGQNQDDQFYSDLISRLRSKSLTCNAYGYSWKLYEDNALLRFTEYYESYDAFLQKFLGKEIYEVTAETAVKTIVQRLVQQGTAFSGSDTYAFLISREGDNPWGNGDVIATVNDLMTEIRLSHPYCTFYSGYARLYDDTVVICFNPNANSYEEYLEYYGISHFEVIPEENAFETIRAFMQDNALADQTSEPNFFYIEKANNEEANNWTNTVCPRLSCGKYGSLYNCGSNTFGDNWVQVCFSHKYNDLPQRREILDTSYDVSESASFALIQNVLNADSTSPHEQYHFWIAKDNGAYWYPVDYKNYINRLKSFVGDSLKITSYDYTAEILHLQLTP